MKGPTFDYLTFTSDIVRSLAWPVGAVLLAFIFKSEVRALLNRLRHFKHKDTEVGFADEVSAAQEKQLERRPELDERKLVDERESRILRIMEVSPSAAIVEAWTLLEAALRRRAKQLGLEYPQRGPVPLQIVLEKLHAAGDIDAEDTKLVLQMRQWRNSASHREELETVDSATAWKYTKMALVLMSELEEQ